ncbi:hypothetical protein ACYOEI_00985 [Singulisphaera rosea]
MSDNLTGYVQFVDDEQGYLRWLAENPNGFVVDSFRVPTGNYLKLHRTSCKLINTGLPNNWTTRSYIKTCSTIPKLLDRWAVDATGFGISPCGVCDPQVATKPDASTACVAGGTERPNLATQALIDNVRPCAISGKGEVPATISTGCPELDKAWSAYAQMILRSDILIPDTEEDLNWHAFLGHSIDMQGFRAAEFAGIDPLTRHAPDFIPLKTRGIGIPELASLWQIKTIRDHLRGGRWDEYLRPETIEVLRTEGGEIGKSLADAFEKFPRTKYRWSLRALLQNSDKLSPFRFSFREWLRAECDQLGIQSFPPSDFRQGVPFGGGMWTIEQALRTRLAAEFFMVGPAMSAYMICDWQLWLWREGLTAVFANFKLDSFHEKFVKKFGRGVVPTDEAGFIRWWFGLHPELPPRLANECIWLAVENKLVSLS